MLFHFDKVEKYTKDPRRCIMGTAPTFHTINAAYGQGTSEEWLVYAWTRLSEHAGNKGKITDYQLRDMAKTTVSCYGYLKISEFMLFALWFKAGRYNHIFGMNVDPLQLMVALRNFIAERNDMIARYEQDERDEARRKEMESRPPMTWDEYARKNNIKADNPLGNLFINL